MKTDTETTLAIFRTFKKKDGETYALFPYLPHDCNGLQCVTYAHNGQHGGGDCSALPGTRPATDAEIALLKAELERIGYHLTVRRKIPADAYTRRKEAL